MVKHGCQPKAVLHTANAMDNAMPTEPWNRQLENFTAAHSWKGNLGEVIEGPNTRRHILTAAVFTPANS